MNQTPLRADQIAHYLEEGYLILPEFFAADEVRAMLTELERFKSEGLGRNVATDGDGQTHSQTKVNYQIIPLYDKSDLFRALPYAPKVKETVRQLIGDPVVRHLEQIFLKPPRMGAGTSWHQDNAYFQLDDPRNGVGMWIALHDATIANGTLHVIPRSFAMSFAYERDLGSDHHIMLKDADEENAVPAELKAGGCVFFNYGMAHCTKENKTDKERAGLAYHFYNANHKARLTEQVVHVTGSEATGGVREYGVRIEGTWEDEVRKLTV